MNRTVHLVFPLSEKCRRLASPAPKTNLLVTNLVTNMLLILRKVIFVLGLTVVLLLMNPAFFATAAPPSNTGWISQECIGINIGCEPGSSPAPPSSANLLLESDFETGEYRSYDWVSSGNEPQIVTAPEPVCRGNFSAKFPLDYYKDRVRYRTELSFGKHPLLIGQEYWLGFAMYVPTNITEPWGGLQFHPIPDQGESVLVNPNMVFWIRDGQWHLATAWDAAKISDGPDGGFAKFLGAPKQGRWTEVVLHFKVTYKPDGFLEAWVDGVPVFAKYNIGTTSNDDRGPYMKIGLYVYQWKNNTTPAAADAYKLIYFDEVRLGDRYSKKADVEPRCGN